MSVNLEVKGTVAKLLAQENLIVEHKNVQTAQFNVDTRVLTLPVWERASEEIFDLLVAHEVGHALYTPNVDPPKNVPHAFINVVEDVRIEKLIKRRFGGLSKTFYKGYQEFHDMDFFSTKGEDFTKMSLADRVNLHFKVGPFLGIKFALEEQPIVQSIQNSETWEDVLTAAKLLYLFDKEKAQQPKKENDSESEEITSGSQVGNSTDGDDRGDSDDNSESDPIDSWDDPDQSDMDPDDSDTRQNPSEPSVNTAESESGAIKNLASFGGRESRYVQIPDIPIEKVVIPNKEIDKRLTLFWDIMYRDIDDRCNPITYLKNEYVKYKKSVQKEVNYMVKEFECRKSADSYSRASTSRTGVLDCGKLHTYKFNEDLFKKVTTIPDGKNHGLIFILDWSGSMGACLEETAKQLFNLAWFCRKVNIPFRVYAFTNCWHEEVDESNHVSSLIDDPKPNELWIEKTFRLLEFINSDCNAMEFEKQCLNFWNLSAGYQRVHLPMGFRLSGTPLNEVIMCLHNIIPEFKSQKRLQKVHTVILTDGESQFLTFGRMRTTYQGDEVCVPSSLNFNTNVYLRDPVLRTTYKLDKWDSVDDLIKNFTDRNPDVNVIGIRLSSTSELNKFLKCKINNPDVISKYVKTFVKQKSVSVDVPAYSKMFVMNQTNMHNTVDFDVAEGANKSTIRAAFKKSLTKSKFNRKILSEFVELVA